MPLPALLAGENVHSRYFSEDAYKAAAEPKELMIIPNANHVDLSDRVNIIPFDKLETLVNGTTIHPDGAINESNGKTTKLKEDQYITIDGWIRWLSKMETTVNH